MRWSQFSWTALVALVLLEGIRTEAASNPHTEEMLKTLLELDRMYAAVARPSLRSGPSNSAGSAYMEPKVQRALNMLRLQNLDKLYAEKSRPRFGKRGGENFNVQRPEYEGQEYQAKDSDGDWMPVRR